MGAGKAGVSKRIAGAHCGWPHPARYDKSNWLMGQAILRNHQIDGVEKDSVGFWCDAKAARKGMPTSDKALCRAVSAEAGLTCTDEPGLSLIVPHVNLLAATIRNYYYSILTGKLVVEVDGTVIDAASFETVSTSLGSEVVPAWMLTSLSGQSCAPSSQRTQLASAAFAARALVEKWDIQVAAIAALPNNPLTLISEKRGLLDQAELLNIILQSRRSPPWVVSLFSCLRR
jgi:hypothetical protein